MNTEPVIVILTKCSKPFWWYERLVKKIDDDDESNVSSRMFLVDMMDDGMYKTLDDVAGPGVKGFIHPDDVRSPNNSRKFKT